MRTAIIFIFNLALILFGAATVVTWLRPARVYQPGADPFVELMRPLPQDVLRWIGAGLILLDLVLLVLGMVWAYLSPAMAGLVAIVLDVCALLAALALEVLWS